MSQKNKLFGLATFCISIVLFTLIAELGLRTWYSVKNWMSPPFSFVSEDLGWRPTANLSKEYTRRDYGNILFTSLNDGFRRYGDPLSSKTKVLVLGDSFTQAYHVSDGLAYFDYLDNSLTDPEARFEVFSFAAGGYGTLQQLLALRKYAEQIQPDIVVWQFCGNDFINNSWQLERQSFINSSHMRRPYHESGETVYRHPDGQLGWWAERSYLIRKYLVVRSSYLKRRTQTIEHSLSLGSPLLIDAIGVTKQILNQAISENPQTKFYSLFAGSEYFGWELDSYLATCDIDGMTCLPEIHEELASAREMGVKVQGTKDGHWTVKGHQLAGKALLRYLSTHAPEPSSMEEKSTL